jgi:Golgi-body localisation protein domain
VSATDDHFQAISNIVTKLILFSDAAHKTRSEKLETLLFTYDFTDLASAATVVENLQSRLRAALETEQTIHTKRRPFTDHGKLELLKLKAHIFLLAEELDFLFEAIKLAQDRFDDQTDQKSALLLHASSSEISWRMLDEQRDLLAKLAVRDIDYSWLSRQDSSTVNNLAVGNLQAFDGSPNATWAEILCKHDEPVNHPLLKVSNLMLISGTILTGVLLTERAFYRIKLDSLASCRRDHHIRRIRVELASDAFTTGRKDRPPNYGISLACA